MDSLLLSSGGMVGDIWSTGAFSFESPLKDLLDGGDYTMEQLLAEDELLQELRGVHPELIQFFSTPEAVTKLVEYVILPIHQLSGSYATKSTVTAAPNGDTHHATTTIAAAVRPRDPGEWLAQKSPEKSKTPEADPEMRYIRFPYMACEIICCEIQGVIDMLVDGYVPEDHVAPGQVAASTSTDIDTPPLENGDLALSKSRRILDLLFSLLYTSEPGQLDDYRAGYFEKILTVLFRKRPAELTIYVNEGGGSRCSESLMARMFEHLYSHSIMQIAQRLLLPERPSPPKLPPPVDDEECMGGGAEIIVPGEQDPAEASVKCDWSKSSRALELLLNSLIEPNVRGASPSSTEEEIDEQRLDMSLNASEVLITIIQNSMLSSETMLSLTSPETIHRVVSAATTLPAAKGEEEEFFSPRESILTSAMNVLESLILQLGGYGAVGTMFLLPDDDDLQGDSTDENSQEQQPPSQLIADLGSMVEQLPHLLEALAKLLRHPSTKKWTSLMQFSKLSPEQLLGSSRLRIVRVLESLVLLGDPEVDQKLMDSDCLLICLELFWEFQWCSMLHQSVANLLVHIFEGQNARIEMQEYFLVKCNLLGRLMDSFEDSSRLADVVANLKDVTLDRGVSFATESEKGSTTDHLPVSEDDVDAALEKQEAEMSSSQEHQSDSKDFDGTNEEQVSTEAVRFESRDVSTIGGVAAPSQAFRFGYMGHVIIICQALVHACSNEMEQDEDQMKMENGDLTSAGGNGETNGESLLLVELVTKHALADKWNEFVVTTLASETAIQSCPLGGYGGDSLRPDSLHSHRPGLADDGDIMGDDGMGPPAPPRGMLGGGEVIDMDDNDLDIAASMMASLNLSRPAEDDDSSSNSGSLASGDSEKSYNSGETAGEKSGYVFDDPLGKAGALGIELGRLTKYKGGSDGSGAQQAVTRGDDDSDSSSDEEPQSGGDCDDVPVMDLFVGNFDPDFANFDQAGGDFGDFTGATIEEASPQRDDSDSSAKSAEIEEIFGKGDHAELLELDDEPAPQTSESAADAEPIAEEVQNDSSDAERPVEISASQSSPPESKREDAEQPLKPFPSNECEP
jgi:hypothetical protein